MCAAPAGTGPGGLLSRGPSSLSSESLPESCMLQRCAPRLLPPDGPGVLVQLPDDLPPSSCLIRKVRNSVLSHWCNACAMPSRLRVT